MNDFTIVLYRIISKLSISYLCILPLLLINGIIEPESYQIPFAILAGVMYINYHILAIKYPEL